MDTIHIDKLHQTRILLRERQQLQRSRGSRSEAWGHLAYRYAVKNAHLITPEGSFACVIVFCNHLSDFVVACKWRKRRNCFEMLTWVADDYRSGSIEKTNLLCCERP
jgi:hypothetical protein